MPRRQLHFVESGDVLAVDFDLFRVGHDHRVDHPQHCRFAAAGWPNKNEKGASLDAEREIFDGWQPRQNIWTRYAMRSCSSHHNISIALGRCFPSRRREQHLKNKIGGEREQNNPIWRRQARGRGHIVRCLQIRTRQGRPRRSRRRRRPGRSPGSSTTRSPEMSAGRAKRQFDLDEQPTPAKADGGRRVLDLHGDFAEP